MGYGQRNPPVMVGEEYEVKIESVGSKGDGLAKIEGFAVFVDKSEMDQRLRMRVTKVLDKVAFAEILEILEE